MVPIPNKFTGKKAFVIAKDHPHFGASVICKGHNYLNGKSAMIFYNPNSEEEFCVFNAKDIKWL